MTIEEIVKELRKSGCNSKQSVIDKLNNLTLEELKMLRRDIQERINLKNGKSY
jgi:ribosomal protein L10